MSALQTSTFSTDAVIPHRRVEEWQSFLVDTFEECNMDYQVDEGFWASISCAEFGDIGIGRISGGNRSAVRSVAQANTGQDGVVVSIASHGRFTLEQGGRSHVLEPGEADIFHNCLPGRFAAEEASEYWVIAMPAHSVAASIGDTSRLVGVKIGHAKPELRLLTAYLQAIHQTPGLRDPATRNIIGAQVTDLIVAAIGRAYDDAQENVARGVRAARYRLALDEIARRFHEPMLNGERIARALGVSERYVQQLFEENGRTVSQHIMDERLGAARRMLADIAQDSRPVAEIAYAAGFSDISHFGRSYRRRFGETPGRMRRGR